jgi:hypothetical protein
MFSSPRERPKNIPKQMFWAFDSSIFPQTGNIKRRYSGFLFESLEGEKDINTFAMDFGERMVLDGVMRRRGRS